MKITYDELLPALFYRVGYEVEIPLLIDFIDSEFGVRLEYEGDSIFRVVSGDAACLKPDVETINEIISTLKKMRLELKKDLQAKEVLQQYIFEFDRLFPVISTWFAMQPKDFTEMGKSILRRIGKRLLEITN